MHVQKLADGSVIIEFGLQEGNKLAGAIIKNAEDMSSTALELSSILRQAHYQAKNHFRQPPNPWAPSKNLPPSV